MRETVKTGDVIYSSCTDINMPCRHSGIVFEHNFEKFVLHNTPDGRNRHGGSVIADRLDEFVKDREIYEIVRTNVGKSRILEVYNKNRGRIWDAFSFNCEDFVSQIVHRESLSDVRDAWTLVFLTTAILILLD